MKRNILIIFTIVSVYSSVSAQINWIKYADNPVVIKGPAFYDLTAVGQPPVLIENDTINSKKTLKVETIPSFLFFLIKNFQNS